MYSCAGAGSCRCAGVGRFIVEYLVGEFSGADKCSLMQELVGVVVQEELVGEIV